MYNIIIRFYEELNFFLPRDKRKRDIEFTFNGRRSVKDLIEFFGVPHVEVDLILINGESVDFSYIVQNGDRISVYPVFETLSIENVTRLRPVPLRNTRFVLDVHLRKLAKRLRLLGFDVDYEKDRDDEELAEISEADKKILLTRDRQLLMRKNVSRGMYVKNTDPKEQISEVLNRLDLWSKCKPFSRCIDCNGSFKKLEYEGKDFNKVKSDIPECVLGWCREYFQCASCKKIYWKGSHFDKLTKIINRILSKDEKN